MARSEAADDGAEARIVLATAPDAGVAERLARELVERRLAACVNMVPGVRSVYRWRGAIEEASEVLLVVKTTARCLERLERALHELHPYEVPELVALAPQHVAARYLAWLGEETAAADGGEPDA